MEMQQGVVTMAVGVCWFVFACVSVISAHPQNLDEAGDCPGFCDCDNQKNIVTCTDVFETPWSEFLYRLPAYTEEIIVKTCMFDDLSSRGAPAMPRVWNLEISDCILDPEPDSFTSFPNLAQMKLRNCGLENIHSAFTGVPNLRILDLRHNHITALHNDTLDNLGKLIDLDLSYNRLSEIDLYAFQSVPQLEDLTLSHNNITYIHPLTVANLTSLRRLDISYNKLVTLHQQTIFQLPALEQAALRNNDLECNCALQWLSGALLNETMQKYFIDMDTITCISQETGSPVAVATASPGELSCVPPKILVPPKDIKLHAFRSIWVEVNVTGYPPPSVYWITPRGILANTADRPWITPDVLEYQTSHQYKEAILTAYSNGSLHIRHIRHYFVGEYRCVVENPAGVSYITFNVTVTTPFRYYVNVSMIYGAVTAAIFTVFAVAFALIKQCASHFCCRHAQSIDKEIEEFEDLDISFEIYSAGCTPSPAPFTPRPSPHKCVTPAEDWEAARSLHESAANIMGTLVDVREKLRFNVERQVVRIRSRASSMRQTTQRQLNTIRDTSNAYVHTLRSSSSNAASRVRTGMVMGMEQVKGHVQSFRELCGPGNVPQTVSTVSMATNIDSQERSQVVTTITYV